METIKVILTFKSMDEILWCDSNTTSSAVLSHGTIYILGFYKKMKFGIRLKWVFILGTLGSERVKTAYNLAMSNVNQCSFNC